MCKQGVCVCVVYRVCVQVSVCAGVGVGVYNLHGCVHVGVYVYMFVHGCVWWW